MIEELETREIVLHGHRVCYRTAGEGPVIALIHGITGTSDTWREVIPLLVDDHTVIAPDLLGHGESASRAATTRSAPSPPACATS